MSQTVLKHSIKVPRLYKSAARIFMEVNNGGNLKSLIKELNHPNKKGIMSLVVKTLERKDIINELFERTKILEKEINLNQNLAAILITELFWGKRNLQGDSKPIQKILSYQEELLKIINSGEVSVDNITKSVWHPRYVRVNTLKQQSNAVINFFIKRAWKKLEIPEEYPAFLKYIKSNLKEDCFIRDFHLDDILLFPHGTVFTANTLVKNGSILLQDKSSCMATHILSPEPGSTVLDMCAAPGMKTSHLAAYMKNQGKIYAVDRDEKRYKSLLETVKRNNLKCVKTICADILRTDILARKKVKYTDIDYILLDPSCSGTGMLTRVSNETSKINAERLKKLSGLQFKLLHYALTSFPSVKRVVYSTCSIHPDENELVVDKVLSQISDFKLIDCSVIFKQWFNFGSLEYNCGKKCIKSIPNVDYMNGFFIAAFERIFK